MSVSSHRLGATAWHPAVGAGLVLAMIGGAASAQGPAAATRPAISPMDQICADAQPAVWPSSPIARRLQIARMQLVLRACIEDAPFLALLGGLLLEDDDPAQALIWLERSLLLDPGNLGAQADHAAALAALGEPEALRALADSWRHRTDIPPALREKLFPAEPGSPYALPNVRLGQPERPRWGVQGEISLVAGHETNLDRSPRLTELTLTVPEGPLILPVISQPRSGNAAIASALAQAGYALGERTILRSGLNLNARRSRSEPGTDWYQSQWSNELEYRGTGWRLQAEAGVAWVGGPLNEAYRLNRAGLAAEVVLAGCGLRGSGSRDRRKQSATAMLDSTTELWTASLQCPLPGLPGWLLSLSASRGEDLPSSADRPGGAQKLRAEGLRLTGRIGELTRFDLYLRDSQVADSQGYSVLLENNAIRRVKLRQASVELMHSLQGLGWKGWSATLQWQGATQRSNIQLFEYRADTVYGGLRWAW